MGASLVATGACLQQSCVNAVSNSHDHVRLSLAVSVKDAIAGPTLDFDKAIFSLYVGLRQKIAQLIHSTTIVAQWSP